MTSDTARKKARFEQRIEQLVHYNDLMRESTAAAEREFLRRAGNISMAQVRIILTVACHKPCTMGTLAKATQLTPGNMTQAVDALIKKGLLKRKRSATDRRVVYVELTKEGQKLQTIHKEHVRRVFRQWFKKLTDQQQEQLLEIFHLLTK